MTELASNPNVEIVGSKNSNNGGFKITYEPQKEDFAQIQINANYVNVSELEKLSKLSSEFQEIVDNQYSGVSFVVGNIIPEEDVPIKIRRIVE